MTREVTKGGLRFVVDDDHDGAFWDWFESPSWEPDTTQALHTYIDADTLYVDVGAWIGDTVLLAAPRARAVVAFEPDPVARARLRRNIDLNPWIGDVHVHDEALTDRSGPAFLAYGETPGSSLTRVGSGRRFVDARSIVRQLDVRELVRTDPRFGLGCRTFMKIDIEGSEYEVVPALGRLPRGSRPDLLVSFHPNLRFDKRSPLTRAASGLRVLVQNWRVLRAVWGYPYHLAWDASIGAFRDRRRQNLRRLLVPVPLRSSFLIGTFLFTDEVRRPHEATEWPTPAP